MNKNLLLKNSPCATKILKIDKTFLDEWKHKNNWDWSRASSWKILNERFQLSKIKDYESFKESHESLLKSSPSLELKNKFDKPSNEQSFTQDNWVKNKDTKSFCINKESEQEDPIRDCSI